ncbi:MAG: saccharopine dehydrogenase NADP-binding domain-containing protein [Burkholderiaceae bacterium]
MSQTPTLPATPIPLTVLVLGGYGNFGARICRALGADPRIALIIAGRDEGRAQALANTLPGARPARLDSSSSDLAREITALGARLVIHTAGPFQAQGYVVAEACAAAGAHYIDLADGREFVCGFSRALDDRFTQRGLCAVSGASTVPALSSAVIDHLTRGWQRIDAIEICIAPAQTAPRGLATMAGVLSYCGAPIRVWLDGRWQIRHGWADPQPVRFARMAARLAAPCDIPDLQLFPEHYRVSRSVLFRAALEVGITQRALAALATLRRLGLSPRPEALSGVMLNTASWFDRLGSGLGGMFVAACGTDDQGMPIHREWHIAAGDDHGPEIPCMAAILLARELARGAGPAPGAHACVGLLPLAHFQPEFERWGMVTDILDQRLGAAGR